MADEQERDNRLVRSSALVLFLTGVALVGCVALAVGVTVQLLDLPRPRVSANISAVSDTSTGAADSDPATGSGPAADLALVGAAASSASDVANRQAAKLAAKQERAERAAQRASRSSGRKTPEASPTPSPTPTPVVPPRYRHHRWHPYPPDQPVPPALP